MKIVRYEDPQGRTTFGIDQGGEVFEAEGSFPNLAPSGRRAVAARLLAPLAPAQIIGIGQNYRRHAAESNSPVPEYPVVFFKSVCSVQAPGGPIRLPKILKTEKPDYEGELAVVIGRPCLNATEENAFDHVLGYTCGNDVSARDWQREWGGTQWGRAKSFDTFCPLGPVLVTKDEIPDPNALHIRTTLNGQIVQDWGTDDMIFSVRKLIAFLSADTTLPVGTVIMTGTPHGVGMGRTPPLWLKAGDIVTVEIEGIGALTNPVE